MIKTFERKMIDIGYKRCNKCGYFTPQRIYISTTQKMFFGFSYGPSTTQYYLTCPKCKKDYLIDEAELEKLKQFTKDHIPYNYQKDIWKMVYEAHKNNVDYEDTLKLKEFFEIVKEQAKEKIEIQIEDKEFDYLFNAYLTNYAKAKQENKEEDE